MGRCLGTWKWEQEQGKEVKTLRWQMADRSGVLQGFPADLLLGGGIWERLE